MKQKPGLPRGTRDFSPGQVKNRKYITDIIRGFFEKYGFEPIETPAFEKLSTLTGKYGEEGDRLIFKILNSGDFLKKVPEELCSGKNSKKITPLIAEKALRYDLTVPFARYVVQHRNELTFPFKRYQIQPVWRADRPQKGRYREFWQCDADAVGSRSLLQDAEFILLYDDVFTALDIPVDIHINNRKILSGIVEVYGLEDKFGAFTVALDKWDKVGRAGVMQEMIKAGIKEETAEEILKLIEGENARPDLETIKKKLAGSETGKQGVEELQEVMQRIKNTGLKTARVIADLTLARGLDYYTGSIFEVKARDVQLGSIGGGGRYDDLTGIFGWDNMPGVGISFGLDRIYLVMEQTGKFPEVQSPPVQVLLVNFGGEDETYAWKTLKKLRDKGISAELYPEPVKLKKQFQYADKKNIPYVLMAGEEERKQGQFTLKNMTNGMQEKLDFTELARKLKV